MISAEENITFIVWLLTSLLNSTNLLKNEKRISFKKFLNLAGMIVCMIKRFLLISPDINVGKRYESFSSLFCCTHKHLWLFYTHKQGVTPTGYQLMNTVNYSKVMLKKKQRT